MALPFVEGEVFFMRNALVKSRYNFNPNNASQFYGSSNTSGTVRPYLILLIQIGTRWPEGLTIARNFNAGDLL